MIGQFYTICDEISKELYVKKSQFIANIYPIIDESEVKEKLAIVKKKYKGAKHYVFAYRLSNGIERYSDDGEPSGTAGVPILDILRGNGLYNVLVVVTRYFGGILLGTGGLIKAYGDAVKQAIQESKRVKKQLAVEYSIIVEYNDYNSVQHFCSKNDFIITDSSFSNNVKLSIQMREELEEKFTEDINELLDGKIRIMGIRRGLYI